jgi:hypothetical protein
MGDVAILADGLAGGEQVITSGQLRLANGTPVVARPADRRRRAGRPQPRRAEETRAMLSELCIRRPVMTILLMVSFLAAGMFGYRQLPVAAVPRVDFPTIQVSAQLPGASPETMASSVALVLEKQFSTIAGVTTR